MDDSPKSVTFLKSMEFSRMNLQEKTNIKKIGRRVTLLRLLVTIPMTTFEPECCFSTLKRIESFLRSTMRQERLSALEMLTIE